MTRTKRNVLSGIAIGFFLVAFYLSGEVPKKSPKPITDPAKKEEISQDLLGLQAIEIQIRREGSVIDRLQQQYKEANDAYLKKLEKLQKEYGAEGCTLNLDKTWACPPEPGKK